LETGGRPNKVLPRKEQKPKRQAPRSASIDKKRERMGQGSGGGRFQVMEARNKPGLRKKTREKRGIEKWLLLKDRTKRKQ